MHRSVLEDSEFIAWANENAIVLVGNQHGGHGEADVAKPAKGEPKKQCKLYPGLTCDQHAKVYDDAVTKPAKDDKDDKKDPKAGKKDAAKPKKGEPASTLPKFE